MAWNGSDNPTIAQSPNQSTNRRIEKSKNLSRGLLAGLIVVLLSGLVAWLTLGRARTPAAPQDETEKPRQIAEVDAVRMTSTTNDAAKAGQEKVRPRRVGELRDGYRLLPDGTMHKVYGVITSRIIRRGLSP